MIEGFCVLDKILKDVVGIKCLTTDYSFTFAQLRVSFAQYKLLRSAFT